jgi:tRNA threonylcarbamoyladenosine biosynthesis protein TsaB
VVFRENRRASRGVNILAIDTSTEACSAAVLRGDGSLFGEFEIAPRGHVRLLPAMMDRVIEAAGISRNSISHCAFANGPGAFTGIRIAAAQAQGIGIALGIPLLPVSTLAVLAQVALDRQACSRPLVALDARMDEIYWAVYERDEAGLARLCGNERLDRAADIEIDATVDFGIGHGWVEPLRARAGFEVSAQLFPHAESLARLAMPAARDGLGVDAAAVDINYLRNRVAEKAGA